MLFCKMDTYSLLSRTTREKMKSVKSPGHHRKRQRIRNTISLKEIVISLGRVRPGKQLSAKHSDGVSTCPGVGQGIVEKILGKTQDWIHPSGPSVQ